VRGGKLLQNKKKATLSKQEKRLEAEEAEKEEEERNFPDDNLLSAGLNDG